MRVNGLTTKRTVLSAIARLYDPVGWLSPIVIIAKILMQDLWRYNLQWDDPLPEELETRWARFTSCLSVIPEIRMARWMGTGPKSPIEIHGFSDASKYAYAAAVYIRISSSRSERNAPQLLIAKTRVASVKPITIPRLELCAAVLLSHLLEKISFELQSYEPTLHAWTDSRIVLAWLHSDPARWNVFIANRVAAIMEKTPNVTWHHVPSADNPADIASRGMHAKRLATSSLWWGGPSWLSGPSEQWPQTNDIAESDLPEQLTKRRTCCQVLIEKDFMDNISSLTLLERVIARCLRFLRVLKPEERPPMQASLLSSELNLAFLRCASFTQQSSFPQELVALKAGEAVRRNSQMRDLNPFLDEQGIIRVGGRLQKSFLLYS